MIADEFRKQAGKFMAYQNWPSVKEAKECKMIPEELWDVFGDLCECGSENIMSPNLRREMCCDPRCPVKESYKLSKMFSDFGIIGLGPATCRTVLQALRAKDKAEKDAGREGLFLYKTYVEVLMVAWDNYPTHVQMTAAGFNFYQACVQVRNKVMTFPQMVSSLGLAGIGGNASKLFDGIDCFEQLKEVVQETGGLKKFCVSRGVGSPELMFNLASAIEDIAVAEFACSLRRSGLYKMQVCITGKVVCNGVGMTKARFLEMCNELCIDKNGAPLLEIINSSGPVSVPFVLYSNVSGSAKYNTGRSRGCIVDEFGRHSVLMNVSDFYNWLEGAINRWNSMEGQNWIEVMAAELQQMKKAIAF